MAPAHACNLRLKTTLWPKFFLSKNFLDDRLSINKFKKKKFYSWLWLKKHVAQFLKIQKTIIIKFRLRENTIPAISKM